MIYRGCCSVKRIFLALLFVSFSALTGCYTHARLRHPESRLTLVDELKSNTVALVVRDKDGDINPFCSGVWVDKDVVLTADHCARAPVEILVKEMAMGGKEDKVLEGQVQNLEDGFKIQYIVNNESTGVWREPKALHTLAIVKHDKAHDVALLKVVDPKDVPNHHIAPLADKEPALGEEVHVMGHPSGLTWTYVHGYVGAIREENFRPIKKKGPFIQIVGSVWRGNSGGGVYNDNRELLGIASFLAPAPNESFFIHIETIRTFLGRPAPR